MTAGSRWALIGLWAGFWATLHACLSLAPASAQSERYPPTAKDYDDQREHGSQFWDQVVEPDMARYRERVDRAADRLQGRDAESVRRAENALLEAVALIPDEPRAHWLLARLYESEERWRECVDAYEKVARLDPVYTPDDKSLPKERGPEWALDFGQALCHAQLGGFEDAIDHYQRILKRGASQDARVYRGLGEAYMALGRLREAISALEVARQRDPKQWHVNYSLAVAYDRAEMDASAAQALAIARRHDPRITALEALDALYAPAADRYYYLGLTHAAHGHDELAIAYFRQYVAFAGESPWTRRADEHLRLLGRDPLPAATSIGVSDKVLDRASLAEAIGRARGDLHACLADTPGLVLEVRITVLGRSTQASGQASGRRGARSPARVSTSSPGPGVKAETLYSFATTEEEAVRATACVEERAERIEIPRVRGDEAQYRTISFPLVAPL